MLTSTVGLGSDKLEEETFARASVQRNQPPRILLVEDEQIIRDALVPILFRAGFDCRECADGRSAIDLLADGMRIDLVLSNLLLPEVDGWTLFLHVRQRYPRIPFVFMTAVRATNCSRDELLATVRAAFHHNPNPLLD